MLHPTRTLQRKRAAVVDQYFVFGIIVSLPTPTFFTDEEHGETPSKRQRLQFAMSEAENQSGGDETEKTLVINTDSQQVGADKRQGMLVRFYETLTSASAHH